MKHLHNAPGGPQRTARVKGAACADADPGWKTSGVVGSLLGVCTSHPSYSGGLSAEAGRVGSFMNVLHNEEN